MVLASRPPIIDAHAHLSWKAADRIEHIRRAAGVVAYLNLSGGNYSSTLDGVPAGVRLATALPGHILNAYTPDFDGLDEPWWGVREAMGLERSVREHGFVALKISKALGLYLRDPAGALIDVDDPRFFPLWERAGELGVPVFIHVADPKAFWEPPTPQNERWDELQAHPEWSFWGTDAPPRLELLYALERVIEAHPQTTFVCVHFGNNAEDPGYVSGLLDRHPNTAIDLGARIPEVGRHPPEVVRALFERHASRILFATDIGVSPYGLVLGSSGGETPTEQDAQVFYERHFQYLETADRGMTHPTPIQGPWTIDAIALSEEVLERVYYRNAAELLRVTLSAR